jgi:DnaJ family protein C protein 3
MKKSSESNDYNDCIYAALKIQEHDPNSVNFYIKSQSYVCSCYTKAQQTTEAIKHCSDLLRKHPNDAEALYNRAQAYIIDEQLDLGNFSFFLFPPTNMRELI